MRWERPKVAFTLSAIVAPMVLTSSQSLKEGEVVDKMWPYPTFPPYDGIYKGRPPPAPPAPPKLPPLPLGPMWPATPGAPPTALPSYNIMSEEQAGANGEVRAQFTFPPWPPIRPGVGGSIQYPPYPPWPPLLPPKQDWRPPSPPSPYPPALPPPSPPPRPPRVPMIPVPPSSPKYFAPPIAIGGNALFPGGGEFLVPLNHRVWPPRQPGVPFSPPSPSPPPAPPPRPPRPGQPPFPETPSVDPEALSVDAANLDEVEVVKSHQDKLEDYILLAVLAALLIVLILWQRRHRWRTTIREEKIFMEGDKGASLPLMNLYNHTKAGYGSAESSSLLVFDDEEREHADLEVVAGSAGPLSFKA